MKKLSLLALLLFASVVIGFAQCVPIPPTGQAGFCPPPSGFPCIEQGVPFDGVITLENWDTVGGIVMQSLRIDSFTNMPAGLSYVTNPSNGTFPGGGTGCIEITGQTNAAAGSYQLGLYVRITLSGLGSFSGELAAIEQQLIALGIIDTFSTPTPIFPSYYLRVNTQGASCTLTGSCNGEKSLISGTVFFDANGNGVQDGSDNPMVNMPVLIAPISMVRYTNATGYYYAYLDSGTYDIGVTPPGYFTVSTPVSSYNIALGNMRNDSIGNNFGLTPNAIVNDMSVSLTSSTARPGFFTSHWIHYQNVGATPQSGSISYTPDPSLTVHSLSVASSQTGNTHTWNFSNLNPGQQEAIYIMLSIPVNTGLGDTFISSVYVTPAGVDTILANNQDTTMQIVSGSYDPNDKQVHPDDIKNGVRPGTSLTYTVRFQNTGTDTAFTVVIRDTLDDFLNGASFKTIAASHPYDFELEGNKYGIWTFNNILLPDSGTDEPSSHGFVKYLVALKNNVPDETRVKNSASIYFDFNAPVKTNTIESRVDFTSGILEKDVVRANLFPNPTSGAFTLSLSTPVADFALQILNISGKVVKTKNHLSGETAVLDVKGLENGVYLYQVVKNNVAIAKGKLTVLR